MFCRKFLVTFTPLFRDFSQYYFSDSFQDSSCSFFYVAITSEVLCEEWYSNRDFPCGMLKRITGKLRQTVKKKLWEIFGGERTLGGSMNSPGINSGRGFSSNFGRISDRNSGITYTKNPTSTSEENLAKASCRKPEKWEMKNENEKKITSELNELCSDCSASNSFV